jgi:hypothetical protein
MASSLDNTGTAFGDSLFLNSSAWFVACVVASAFGLAPAAILESARGPAEAAFARQVAMYLTHTSMDLDYATTGRLFGRDRTTARHACQVVEDRRENVGLDASLDCLERAIGLWLKREGDAP